MEVPAILEQLERLTQPFPHAAVQAAIERREEVTPGLLRILEDTVDRAEELRNDFELTGHLFALYLLAQFREVRAYPLVMRIAALPEKLLDDLLGDNVTEDLDRMMASVCGGDVGPIQALVENEEANEWSRIGALSALTIAVAAGIKSREEVLAYLAELLRGKLERRQDSIVWSEVVCAACDLYPEGLLEDIGKAYDEGLVDVSWIGFDDVERHLGAGLETTRANLANARRFRLIDDTVGEMEWWRCFRNEDDEDLDDFWAPPVTTVRRTQPKIGRNDPCPCGSGKKYKKCCGP